MYAGALKACKQLKNINIFKNSKIFSMEKTWGNNQEYSA